jgi:signal transduction histidine kinase/sensor domain CHASE-containing protein/FixJ family two-component response regulator
VAVACAVIAWLVDGGYARLLLDRERATVQAAAADLARAIEREHSQRVSLLTGLRAFARSYRGDRAQLERDFPVFAAGLLSGLDGVRALQLVHAGRIAAIWPMAGNEAALGLDLATHPDPRVVVDVRRALAEQDVVVTGPLDLVQGGRGLAARLAVGGEPGSYPDQVAVIVDVPNLLADAGLGDAERALAFALRDDAGGFVAGASSPLPDPVYTVIALEDGSWQLAAVPDGGWGASTQRERRLLRVSAAVIAVLLLGIAGLSSGRQARLVRAVDERTLALRDSNAELGHEVEERRAAERALRERADELRVALRAGQMGLWAWDFGTGRIRWSDEAARLYGVSGAPPTTYEAYLDLLDAEDRTALHEAVQATLSHGATMQLQHRVRGTDAGDRWLYATGELEVDEAGRPVRLLGIVMDVTGRVQLEQQLRQAQKMDAIGTLAGGIAHDFNNLLTAILGFARLAQESLLPLAAPRRDGLAGPDAGAGAPRERVEPRVQQLLLGVSDDLSELIRAGDRAALLTTQLLAFSRQQIVRPVVLDANTVVDELQRMLGRLLDERIALELRLTREPLWVRGDAGQLSQVVLNLVVNARDALPNGGRIVVATRRLEAIDDDGRRAALGDRPAVLDGGAWVELRVEDDGVGIPEEIRDRIFDPFFTTKPRGKGTGLGLSTAYGIVTQAGGHIVVESAEGQGTVMRVFLPSVPGTGGARTPASGAAAVRTGHESILVVEDEPGVRRLVAEILERAGYAVRTAVHGREALQRLDEEEAVVAASEAAGDAAGARRIALVISDVVMPELGGIELSAELEARRPGLPVLLMSGYPASQAGVPSPDVPLLTKPFTPGDLLLHVRTLLEAGASPLPRVGGPS